MPFFTSLFSIIYRLKIYRCLILFICWSNAVQAQLWNGNLGAPVLNITFGAGPSQPLASDATSFTYANGCPSEGQYAIEHQLPGCFGDTWTILVGDYTHDFEGHYMLVNGGAHSGTVLVQKVDGLCGNTTYQFAAFITNVLRETACGGTPALPNITFSVEATDGTILESYNTGDLPITVARYWTEYGVCYTTPPVPMPIVLRIKNNATGSCGCAFVMDNVSLKPAGPGITLTLDGKQIQQIDLCSGYKDTLLLEANYTTGFIDPAMHWQQSTDGGRIWSDIPGANTPTYLIPRRNQGIIAYRFWMAQQINLGIASCTINSDMIVTNVHPGPDQLPLQPLPACLNSELVLPTRSGFQHYEWKGPNGYQSSQPMPVIKDINYADQGLYTLLASDDVGCTALDSFLLTVYPGAAIATNPVYTVCEGTTVHLAASGEGNFAWTPAAYLSDTNIGNPFSTPHDSIQYQVVLTNMYGCKDSALVNINILKKAVVSAGADQFILAGDTVLLNGSVKGTGVYYLWTSTGAVAVDQVIQPRVAPLVETSYTLSASATTGCGDASSTTTVHVYKDIFLPGAFSPNADGLNDVYHIIPPDSYPLISFAIFNRQGKKVFSTANPNMGWDGNFQGTPQAPGTYVYYLEMKRGNGKKIIRKGSIVLVR
ncbi:gliding motility-associated C-terminal domain-containing protein [Ferruginibacter paludis]|uniref:gliding motility-associated C-terminal domain-containing protein n=1 Tax=Ferruginibacter paludis TaxID=1310417 RepID=UPI0025B40447|nr:gliding motility-associated C-terminal domain-containing protein [Ferruginibacter paludis]MDN3656925.1 gliding motility-associated C-terminal domain-containing protein [Ferruginibacter paludis]